MTRTRITQSIVLFALLPAGCIRVSGTNVPIVSTQAQETEERAWAVEIPPKPPVEVKTFAGSVIIVNDSNRKDARVRAKVLAYGETAEEAKARLTEVKVRAEWTGKKLVVIAEYTGDPKKCYSQCELDISLPNPTGVYVRTGNGRITVRGAAGAADLDSDVGTVVCRDQDGPVRVHSGNGSLQVLQAKGRVQAETDVGSVLVDAAGGDVQARSGNGAIEIKNSNGLVTAKTDVGGVQVLQCQGNVDIQSGNGALVVTQGNAVKARAAVGAVTVSKASGAVDARSGNGKLTVQGAGSVLARTDVGGIEISSVPGTVDCKTGNGSVSIRGGSGIVCQADVGGIEIQGALGKIVATTGNGSIGARLANGFADSFQLKSDVGAVRVTLPESSRGTIQVHSDVFPLQLEGPRKPLSKDGKSPNWAIRLSADGPMSSIHAGNGQVTIRLD